MKILIAILAAMTTLISGAFTQDTTDGIIWHPTIDLMDGSWSASGYRLAMSGDDTLHIVMHGEAERPYRLPYLRSIDGGVTFEPIRELLTDTVTYWWHAIRPFVLADHKSVYIIFEGATAGEAPVRMLKSTDGGTSFAGPTIISPDTAGFLDWAAMSGDSIVVVYTPRDGYRELLRSPNRGQTWTKTDQNFPMFTRIAMSPGCLHMATERWTGSAMEINYRTSTDLGDTWIVDTLLSVRDTWWSDIPTIAASTTECGTELLVAWRDTKYGWHNDAGASVITRSAVSNGRRWFPEQVMTDKPWGAEPFVMINGNVRGLTWWNDEDTYHVIARGTSESFLNFKAQTDLTPGWFSNAAPRGTVSSKAMHIAWQSQVGWGFGPFHVYYRRGEFLQNQSQCELSTGWVMFDSTNVHESSYDTVIVENSGTDTLVVGTVVTDDTSFIVEPMTERIPPSESRPFVVRFSPAVPGDAAGKAILYHSGRSSPDCFSVTGTGRWRKETIEYAPGWNLVSIPLTPGYSQSLPSLYAYDHGYARKDTLLLGLGYWAKLPDSGASYEGIVRYSDTVEVAKGWNLIGSITVPVAVSQIIAMPDTIVGTPFFGFSEGAYRTADTISPGRAYWVKVKADGEMVMTRSTGMILRTK